MSDAPRPPPTFRSRSTPWGATACPTPPSTAPCGRAAGLKVVLVGDEARLEAALRAGGDLPIEHAGDVIGMDDHAGDVRRRKDASVVVATRLVKEGKAAAVVSMGHSGATMAAALLVLGRLPGVERPAILANIPTKTGYCALIDAGANADCRPAWLQQFAVMGSVYARAFYDKPSRRSA
jgi:phosphate acyltransferase